ncbi:hypothetical protein GOV10_01425 [Candidatus Woesearchaeota archaeon]|nr:hypothetical protein [Candidatus Woesearchaeota archaeon]
MAALAKDEPGAVKIADLIAEPRTIQPSTPFRDLTLIDERILPVMKGNKIQGYVRRRDSLQLLDEYYSTHPSVARKLSSIRQLLSVPTPLFAKDSIRDAVSVIVKEKMSIGVIASKSGTGYRVMGLVPERLLVEELINFKGTIHQMNVETAMKRARTAEVTLPSLEGVRLILESEYRAIVVTENDVLQGVLSEHILVKELRGALDKII